MTAGPGQQALDALDKALAGRPHKDDPAFAAALDNLCIVRDDMLRRFHAEGAVPDARRRLEHVNSVLTVVLAGYFPLGPIPWDEVEKARGWLQDLMHEVA